MSIRLVGGASKGCRPKLPCWPFSVLGVPGCVDGAGAGYGTEPRRLSQAFSSSLLHFRSLAPTRPRPHRPQRQGQHACPGLGGPQQRFV